MNGERLAVTAWAALIALQPAWYLWLAVPANGRALLALTLVLPPLLLPLLALRRGLGRALVWIGIVALFYFCHGVVAAWVVPAARIPAVIEATLCMILILALGVRTRALKRARARRVPRPGD